MKANKNLMGSFGNQIDLLNTLSGGISMTSVEVDETPHSVVIRMKTPAVSGDAYNIEMARNQLTIYTLLNNRAGLRVDQEEKAPRVFIPSFVKAFPLPAHADGANIEASFEEGELRVIIPLNPLMEEKPRRIMIKHN